MRRHQPQAGGAHRCARSEQRLREVLLLNAVERDVEHQRGVRRNRIARASVAVGELRWNDQAALPTHAHARHTLIPTSNHGSRSKAEGKVGLRVELRAFGIGPARVVEPSRVSDSQLIAWLSDRSGTDDEIDL